MAGFFASRTIYQVVVAFEVLFSIVIFAFALKSLIIYHQEGDEFRSETPFLLYSICTAIALSVIQIIFAIMLIYGTRGSRAFDKKDHATGLAPTIWLIQAVFSFPLLLFIFVTPVALQYDLIAAEELELQYSLREMFSYVIVDALFKPLFIWMIFTTLRRRGGGGGDGGGGGSQNGGGGGGGPEILS